MSKSLNDYDWDRNNKGKPVINHNNHQKMKDLLDSKGPGFCLAKWTQVTMHLGNGLTHSCHHPSAHPIPLEELEVHPGSLHNTKHKKEQRRLMLNGQRPAECDYCWRIEDNKDGNFSDRVYKSFDHYSFNDHDDISNLKGHENIFPRYVEVSFSNVCNFKCAYCGPNFSSIWAEEINRHGAYELEDMLFNGGSDIQKQIANREDNPYTDAFWKWFPKAITHMHTFRITGGEPLLSKHTFKVIDYLKDNPMPNLEFAINSNAGVPDKLWKKFVSKIKILEQQNCVKKFTLFTSAEATDEQCEYIRDGIVWKNFVRDIEYFLDNTNNTRVTFMSAFNLLSAPTFQKFLEYVLTLKKKYSANGVQNWMNSDDVPFTIDCFPTISGSSNNRPNDENVARVGIDIPYVRQPDFLDARLLTKDVLANYLIPAYEYMTENAVVNGWTDNIRFEVQEIEKFRRILFDLIIQVRYTNEDETRQNYTYSRARRRFLGFTQEYEKRRNKNFVKTFPELEHFYTICKLEQEKHNDK